MKKPKVSTSASMVCRLTKPKICLTPFAGQRDYPLLGNDSVNSLERLLPGSPMMSFLAWPRFAAYSVAKPGHHQHLSTLVARVSNKKLKRTKVFRRIELLAGNVAKQQLGVN